MKIIIVLLVFVHFATSFEAYENDKQHNVLWGAIEPTDRLLHREIVYKKSKLFWIVLQDWSWPENTTSPFIINAIKATDQIRKGNGGYATLYEGGPGSNSVKIHFASQRGHGFDFIIEIYGH